MSLRGTGAKVTNQPSFYNDPWVHENRQALTCVIGTGLNLRVCSWAVSTCRGMFRLLCKLKRYIDSISSLDAIAQPQGEQLL